MIPFFLREVVQRKRVTILTYHDLDPETADKHFSIIKSKYNIISLKEYLHARKNGMPKRIPSKALILTFDDGYKNNFQLIPLFVKHTIFPTIFLCSGIAGTNRHFWWEKSRQKTIRKYLKRVPDGERIDILNNIGFNNRKEYDERISLSKEEIEIMRDHVDFQSHSMFHPILTKCPPDKVRKEISQSKTGLEQRFGLEIYALSYPNGDYSNREIEIAKDAGYECGLTLDVGFNSQHTDIFKLKRICIPDDADKNELIVKSSGLWDYMKKIVHKFG